MGNPIADKISLGALISGGAHYAQTVQKILRAPLRFPHSLAHDSDSDAALRNAAGFVIYAIVLIFFMLIPVFSAHRTELPKAPFLLRYLLQFSMYACLLHLGLRFIGRSRNSLRSTTVVYAHIVGTGAPLFILLAYPVLLGVGPIALFGNHSDLPRLAAYYEKHAALSLWLDILSLTGAALGYLIITVWFSHTHKISKRRTLLAMILAGIAGSTLQLLVLHPMYAVVFPLLEQWLKYV